MAFRTAARLMLASLSLLCIAEQALAVQLRWASGGSDLQFQEERQCTLLVCADELEGGLPQEWILAYDIADSSGAPLGLRTDYSDAGDVGICWVGQSATSEADRVAHRSIVQHCSIYSTARAECARYLFLLRGGVRGTFRVVLQRSGDPQRRTVQVTANGGASTLHPVVAEAAVSSSGHDLMVVANGDALDEVALVRVLDDEGVASGDMEVLTRGVDELAARLPGGAPLRRGRLEFVGTDGRIDAIDVPQNLTPTEPLGVQDQLIIRFVRDTVEPPNGAQGGTLEENEFLTYATKESLAVCGVLTLRRLFPWFKREEVHSRNLIGEAIELEDLSDTYVATMSPGIDQPSICKRLSKVPGVLSAGIDPLLPAAFQYNDPLWSVQWGLENAGQSICLHSGTAGEDIDAAGAWIRTRGAGASMAILDAGTDLHPDISGCHPCTPACPWCGARRDANFTTGGDEDSTTVRHGNSVASLAMARSNNFECIVGVAEDATTWAIKVVGGTMVPTSKPSWVSAGIDYARQNARGNMNLSLGFEDPAFSPANGTKQELADACLNAFYSGYLLVAATGNTNDSAANYPAAFRKRVCAVGATDVFGHRWTDQTYGGGTQVGSTFGSWTDLVAPGGRYIATAWTNKPIDHCHNLSNCTLGSGTYFSGTSAAAPLVTGVASLLRSYNPNLLGEDIQQIMMRTASDIVTPAPAQSGFDVATGYGKVQASAALDYITPPRYLRQRSIGFQGTSGTLSFNDSSSVTGFVLENDPDGVSNAPRTVTRVRMVGAADLGGGFQPAPTIWVRSSGSAGWDSIRSFNHQQDVRWGRLRTGVPVQPTSATFETFVYLVPGTPKLWYPCRPESARVAFTAVGPVNTAVGVGGTTSFVDLRLSPNPFAERLTISFGLEKKGRTTVEVIDIAGRVLARVLDRELGSGNHTVQWDGKTLTGERCAPGVYICRLKFLDRQEIRKLAFVGGSRR